MIEIKREVIKSVRSYVRLYIEPTILFENIVKDEDDNVMYHLKLWYIPHSTLFQVTETKYGKTRTVIYNPDLDEAAKAYNRVLNEK